MMTGEIDLVKVKIELKAFWNFLKATADLWVRFTGIGTLFMMAVVALVLISYPGRFADYDLKSWGQAFMPILGVGLGVMLITTFCDMSIEWIREKLKQHDNPTPTP